MQYIIVADDDEGIRDLLFDLLSERGYKVDTVETGEQLESYVLRCPPDLVWLDLLLPDTDGFSSLAKIKKQFPKTKVICMTAYATNDVIDSSLTLTADKVVAKPFDINDIEILTDEVLKEGECRLG